MSNQDSAVAHRTETDHHHRRAVERVIATMHERLDEELRLEDLAEVAFMSPFYLNRIFHQVTGVPPGRFLTALRLEAAKRLLATTEMSVTDISLEAGYNSLGTFTRRFTELVGTPPSRFRRLAATTQPEGALNLLQRALQVTRPEQPTGGVAGTVEVPRGFGGTIFLGLFDQAVPQSRPVACTLTTRPGEFHIVGAPDGRYHLVSLALPETSEGRDFLVYDTALRGGARGRSVRVREGRITPAAPLRLRPSEPFDPPILLTLPVLIRDKLAHLPAAGGSAAALRPPEVEAAAPASPAGEPDEGLLEREAS